jgi:hypothetical protein
MRYQVFIEQADGSGRIDLADTQDPQSAADLVYGLTLAGSGKGFLVGISILPGDQTAAGGQPTPAAARGSARPGPGRQQ